MNLDYKKTSRAFIKKMRGLTLMELMIVVVIIGIIAAVGYPAYLEQIRKSRRANAQAAINDAAARMEQFFLDRKRYALDMNRLGYGVAVGAPYITPENFYSLTVDPAIPGACPITTCYSITATAINLQTDDNACPTLTLDSRGTKTPAGCW